MGPGHRGREAGWLNKAGVNGVLDICDITRIGTALPNPIPTRSSSIIRAHKNLIINPLKKSAMMAHGRNVRGLGRHACTRIHFADSTTDGRKLTTKDSSGEVQWRAYVAPRKCHVNCIVAGPFYFPGTLTLYRAFLPLSNYVKKKLSKFT